MPTAPLSSAANFFNSANLQLLRNLSQCPLCKAKYQPLHATLIEEKEDAFLVYIKCQHCTQALLVLIMNQGAVLSSLGVLTDLRPEDLAQFKTSSPLAPDEVLDLHLALANHQLLEQLVTN